MDITEAQALIGLATVNAASIPDANVVIREDDLGAFDLNTITEIVTAHALTGAPAMTMLISINLYNRLYPAYRDQFSSNEFGEPFAGTARVLTYGEPDTPDSVVFLYDWDADVPEGHSGRLATVSRVYLFDDEDLRNTEDFAWVTLSEGGSFVALSPEWPELRASGSTREEALGELRRLMALAMAKGDNRTPLTEAEVQAMF